MGIFGKLNENLFDGRPTEYDAQKYFDYAEEQKAKGNFHEALCCYVIIINHGDLGDKPYKAHIELDMQNNNWERAAQSIKAFRKKFPKDKSGWIDKVEEETIKQLKAKTPQKEREPSPLPTIMHDDLEILQQYVDKKKPVLIIGGEYNQKQVILTSNPKATRFVIKSTGQEWPGVTIENVSGISMDEPEESKPSVQTKPSIPVKTKPQKPVQPKPSTTVPPEPKEQQSDWNPIHIYKDPVTGEIVEETDEEYQRKLKEQQKKEKKRPELVFPIKIEHPTFGERFDNYCASLPPFDFYEGDNENNVPDDAETVIKDYLDKQGAAFANTKEAIIAGKYDIAEYNFRCMIGYNVWNPDIYEELMHLYCNHGEGDKLEAVRLYAIDYFTKRRERMERQLIALAEQQGDKELAMEYIRKGEKVAYFRGLFDLYDPFPCIERWKQIDTSGAFLFWPF